MKPAEAPTVVTLKVSIMMCSAPYNLHYIAPHDFQVMPRIRPNKTDLPAEAVIPEVFRQVATAKGGSPCRRGRRCAQNACQSAAPASAATMVFVSAEMAGVAFGFADALRGSVRTFGAGTRGLLCGTITRDADGSLSSTLNTVTASRSDWA